MIETSIIYQDVSPDGKLIATYSGVNVENYADYADIFNNAYNEDTKFATLEKNNWLLDGNEVLFPSSTSQYEWGFVSSTISGANGYYAENDIPQLIIEYTAAQDSVAITMEFDTDRSEYPEEVEIIYYQNNTVLDDSIYTSTTAYNECFVKEVKGYNKVVIKFLKTNVPFRRTRAINIYYGVIRTFKHEELQSVSAIEEVNSISSELSINTMDFSVRNTSDIPFLFQKMQPIQLLYGESLIGIYYIDESKRTAKNNYDISCIDNIGILDNVRFLGGLYTNKNAVDLVDEIMDDTRIEFSIDSSFNNATISGYIPICTKREALLYVCFAIGAVADTSRSNKILIKPLSNQLKATFNYENTYSNGSVTTEGKVTAVSLSAYTYTLGTEASELFKGTLAAGKHTIELTSACYGYTITGAAIVKSDVNYVVVNVASEQEVTLNGKQYTETAIVYTKDNPATKLTDVQKVIKSDGCRLINKSNVQSVLDNLYDYYMKSSSVSTKVIIDSSVSVGDVVKVPTAYDELVECRIERIKLGFGATQMVGEIEGVINE